MEIYNRDFQIDMKNNKTPLTEADRAANRLIIDGLKEAFPEPPGAS